MTSSNRLTLKVCLLATVSLGALDASAATAPASSSEVSEIVVTGSRITDAGFTAPTPTTVVGQADIQKVGAINLEQVINQLPEVRTSLTQSSSTNEAAGAAGNYLDLRGLGTQRVLVLVDGQRFVNTRTTGGVDVSVLPQAVVDNIDVVTGGASAAYGSDAITGVVNFRTNPNFEGGKLIAQGGESSYGDEKTGLVSAEWGKKLFDGRGHLIVAGELAVNGGVPSADGRAWLAAGYNLIANPAFTPTNGQPALLQVPNALAANRNAGGIINSGVLKGTQFLPGGIPAPFNPGILSTATTQEGGDGGLPLKVVPEAPENRGSLYGNFTYEFTPKLTGFVTLSYAEALSKFLNGNATPNDTALTIHSDNAYLPASLKATLAAAGQTTFAMGRNNFDWSSATKRVDDKTSRIVVGLRGDLGGTWSWDSYLTYGKTRDVFTSTNNRIVANFNLALDAVLNPATNTVVCRSTLTNPTNGCVPIDLFGVGSVTGAARNYVNGVSRVQNDLSQTAAEVTVHGQPFSTWAGPVSVAAGLDYRRETVTVQSDPISRAAGFAAGNTQPWSGNDDVKEAFAEVGAPIAKDLPFAKAANIDLAVRETDYSTSGSVTTWKAGATWDVIEGFRFRVNRSRDIRAPSLNELFSKGLTNTLIITDPVTKGADIVTNTSAGNPNLKAEQADTWTVGLVLSPTFMPGFHASIDSYQIDVANAINTLLPQDIANGCQAGIASLCALLTKTNGVITGVRTAPANVANLKTHGIDTEISYRTDLPDLWSRLEGSLTVRALATYIGSKTVTTPTGSKQYAGAVTQPSIEALGGDPHWRANVSATWESGPTTLAVTQRFVGGGVADTTFTSANINVLRADSRWYTDVYGAYKIDRWSSEVFAQVKNLFDRDPPILIIGAFPTAREVYDTIGRTYSVGVRMRF